MARSFWLVQRISYSPLADFKAKYPNAKVIANPFGYGRLGDYEFDYMGSAEYEGGAIPLANNRFAEAGSDLCLETVEIQIGKRNIPPMRMLWIGKEGHPAAEFREWIKEGTRTKESMHAFDYIARGEPVPKTFTERDMHNAVVWWALEANVQWAVAEDDSENEGAVTSHLDRMLASVTEETTQFLR